MRLVRLVVLFGHFFGRLHILHDRIGFNHGRRFACRLSGRSQVFTGWRVDGHRCWHFCLHWCVHFGQCLCVSQFRGLLGFAGGGGCKLGFALAAAHFTRVVGCTATAGGRGCLNGCLDRLYLDRRFNRSRGLFLGRNRNRWLRCLDHSGQLDSRRWLDGGRRGLGEWLWRCLGRDRLFWLWCSFQDRCGLFYRRGDDLGRGQFRLWF